MHLNPRRQFYRLLAAPIAIAGLLIVVGYLFAPMSMTIAIFTTLGLWIFGNKTGLPYFPIYYYLAGIPVYLWVVTTYSAIDYAQAGDQFWMFVLACVWPFHVVLDLSGEMEDGIGVSAQFAVLFGLFALSVIFSSLHKRFRGSSTADDTSSSNPWGRRAQN